MGDDILLVEDDPVLSDVVASRFRKEGWVLYHASSCSEARTLARRHPPAVILLDIVLPDGEGWDLVKDIREIAGDPKIIVVSARAVTRSQLRANKIETFIPKPFSIPHLIDAVQAAITGPRTWTE